jgi:plastin-1
MPNIALPLVQGNQPIPVTHQTNKHASIFTFEDSGDREERVFRFWMNSLGVPVRNLSEDLKDGLVLIRVFDAIAPGLVDWTNVNQKPGNLPFKKIENCQYAIKLAQQLKFSIVAIGGKDIFEGNKKLILAIVWQQMRYHVISVISTLSFGNQKEVTEQNMIDWSNAKVEGAKKASKMNTFKDPSLRDSKFFIDLLDAIKPGSVDYELVTAGNTGKKMILFPLIACR